MDKDLFDELIAACNDAIEYEKGNIQLRSRTVTIPDDEIESAQMLYRKIERLPEPARQKAMRYIDELAAV